MRALVACEYSGTVRDAFIARGHDAMSCDLLPTDVPGPHHQGDVLELLADMTATGTLPDLLIAHPPCTFMANSSARWLYREDGTRDPDRWAAMAAGAEFFRTLLNYPGIPHIAVENPVMLGHAQRIIGEGPTVIVHPWQHSHPESKQTCLWLRGLPPLVPTDVVEGRDQRMWKLPPSPDRWKLRSATYPGIAAAMADQWGDGLPALQGALW